MDALSSETLETLVKLAAAGTSGICIVCIVVSGIVILKTPENASAAKFQTIRFFIMSSVLIAVVSAASTFAASSLDAKARTSLKLDNQKLTTSLDRARNDVVQTKKLSTEALLAARVRIVPAKTTSAQGPLPHDAEKAITEALTKINAIQAPAPNQ